MNSEINTADVEVDLEVRHRVLPRGPIGDTLREPFPLSYEAIEPQVTWVSCRWRSLNLSNSHHVLKE